MNDRPALSFESESLVSHERITTLDVLRGFAVLGILWINIIVFGLPTGGYALPSYLGEAVSANVSLWAFSELLIEGAMRGLFSCLFGASALVYLSSQKLEESGVMRVEYYYRRNLILMLFGLFHAYILLWPYDVLFDYGLFGLLLFPLRRLSAKKLLIIGLLLIVASDISFFDVSGVDSENSKQGVTSSLVQPQSQSEAQQPQKETDVDELTEREDYRESSLQEMDEDVVLHLSPYSELFKSKAASTIEQQTLYLYTTHFYDILGMMLIGMALLKLGVLQGNRSRRFYVYLMLSGFVVAIVLRIPGILTEMSHEFMPENIKDPGVVNYGFTRLPLMLGYIGLIVYLYKTGFFKFIFTVLAAIGKMALTNYIMQTVICIFMFYGIGFGLIGSMERYEITLLCVAIWIWQGIFSLAWLHYYRYGPLEWLWRSAMYGQWQQNRLNKRLA